MKSLAAIVLLAIAFVIDAGASDAAAVFDNANKAYEQRRFQEAAQLYEQVLTTGARTAHVYFNLGNAHYKAGEPGRAIAAYREAQRLDPRDTDLLANLEFVRKKANENTSVPLWKRALRFLSPNEWSVTAALLFWSVFALLALGELQPARRMRGLLLTSAVATVVACVAAGGAIYDGLVQQHGVVVAKQVPVRFGPLTDAQVAFQLTDGAEVVVTDEKGDWIQIREPSRRRGWIRQSDLLLISPRGSVGVAGTSTISARE